AHAIGRAAPRGDRRVDADHLPGQVDQRPAAVARIDGCVGLQEALELAFLTALDIAHLGADNPGRYCGFEAERAAYRQHPVTRAQALLPVISLRPVGTEQPIEEIVEGRLVR